MNLDNFINALLVIETTSALRKTARSEAEFIDLLSQMITSSFFALNKGNCDAAMKDIYERFVPELEKTMALADASMKGRKE